MVEILLGGYPAKQCARVTHNTFSPDSPPPQPPSPELLALFAEGQVFDRVVVDELSRRFAGSDDLLTLTEDDDWERCKQLTVRAMRQGVPIIVGGRLPDVNGRVGAPDVLVRHESGYLPVDVKNHRTLQPSSNPTSPKSRARVVVSTLGSPAERTEHSGFSNKGSHWRDDVMQLAHYTRMLQELGFHATPTADPALLIGGIIGTSDHTPLLGDELGITWYDLTAPGETTFSRSTPGHRKRRSPLERYDHEFGFRITVAEAAAGGAEIVRPFRTQECDTCAWFDHCAQVAGTDDASFALAAGHLAIREWQYLYGDAGSMSVNELAELDPEDHEPPRV